MSRQPERSAEAINDYNKWRANNDLPRLANTRGVPKTIHTLNLTLAGWRGLNELATEHNYAGVTPLLEALGAGLWSLQAKETE